MNRPLTEQEMKDIDEIFKSLDLPPIDWEQYKKDPNYAAARHRQRAHKEADQKDL